MVRRDVVIGSFLGVANLAMTLFLLQALTVLPAVIVFPTVSCGSLALAVVTARVIWGERPPWRAVIGLGIALAAIGLLAG
jgi:drug/metabolite transporter (DMT)-like permease